MTTSFDAKTHKYLIDGKPATGITTVIGVLAKPALIAWSARMCAEFMEKAITSGEYDLTDKAVLGDLLDMAKSAHTKKRDDAAQFGTDSHAEIELYINDCLTTHKILAHKTTGEEGVGLYNFVEWALANVREFLFSERQMFNKDMFLAGTADFGCIMKDGKKLIGDWKTSSGVYGIDYFLQCAGYKILAEAEGDAPYDGCVIVRQGKKSKEDFDVHYRYANPSTKETSTDLWNRLMGFMGIKQTEIINYSDVDAKAFMACLTIYRAQATFKKPNYK